jgi:UDP-N-acetylmuramoyl-L-alanyl-D-glutamate--2,6-diaminopimelate ligase
MGKITSDLSDLVIFTMDDPRFEDPSDIISEMTKDIKKNNYLKIIDRKKAIYKALTLAKDKDTVIILGKGRDNYMAIKDQKIKYSDYDVIKSFFNN